MVAWFIIAIATLAVFAFIAINGVQTVASTTDGMGRVETTRRLDMAVATLLSRAGSPAGNGNYYLQAGVLQDGVYTLPATMSAMATTPFGQPIVYCPFGGTDTGTATTVTSANGTSYAIQTSTATINGQSTTYVVSGRPTFPQVAANSNLLGWVIAPRSKASATPSCNTVVYNPTTTRFEAPDAVVRPIIKAAGSEQSRDQMSREVVFYVSQAGTGKGISQNDPASFISALDFYRTRQPPSMRIVLAAGNYVLPQNYLNIDSGTWPDRGTGSDLALVAFSAGVFIDQNGVGSIQIPGNLTLNAITFDSETAIIANRSRRVTAYGTTAGNMFAYNNGILYANAVTINAPTTNFGIYANSGGIVTIENSGSQTTTINAPNSGNALGASNGGKLLVTGGNLVIGSTDGGTLNAGFIIDPISYGQMRSMKMTYATKYIWGIVTYGNYVSYDTNYVNSIYPGGNSRTFGLLPGGELSLNGGSVSGTAADYAVVDEGGVRISGAFTMIKGAGPCWAGGGKLFNESSATLSSVKADEALPDLTANPALVPQYNTATKNNARRRLLRTFNDSNWSCPA